MDAGKRVIELLEPVLGSTSAERVLIFIMARNDGYARQIARFFSTDLNPIQKQLEKFEAGGILLSRSLGRTRLYSFNPRYPFVNELQQILSKALDFYPPEERDRILMDRRRPRRSGKPL